MRRRTGGSRLCWLIRQFTLVGTFCQIESIWKISMDDNGEFDYDRVHKEHGRGGGSRNLKSRRRRPQELDAELESTSERLTFG